MINAVFSSTYLTLCIYYSNVQLATPQYHFSHVIVSLSQWQQYWDYSIQAVLDTCHPHICLFLNVRQVFVCFRFSIYKFIDLEAYFRIWKTYKIDTYRGIRKTRVIYRGLPVPHFSKQFSGCLPIIPLRLTENPASED